MGRQGNLLEFRKACFLDCHNVRLFSQDDVRVGAVGTDVSGCNGERILRPKVLRLPYPAEGDKVIKVCTEERGAPTPVLTGTDWWSCKDVVDGSVRGRLRRNQPAVPRANFIRGGADQAR